MEAEYEIPSCIRGYHIYKNVWVSVVGEVLECERQQQNDKDRYAVAVKKDRTIIGHLPRKISRVCLLFLRRGGSIRCIVIERRRYSSDLPQGGLEIPCRLLFMGEQNEIKKLKVLLKNHVK